MVSLRSFDLLRKVRSHAEARPDSVAITDIPNGLSITYPAFLQDIVSLGGALLSGSETDLDEARVVVLCEKGYLVALCLVAVWAAGGLAVPILPSLPIPEQSYIVENSESTIILCDEKNKQRSEALAKIVVDAGGRCQVKVISLSDIRSETKLDSADLTSHLDKFSELEGDRRAMMLYTSGTTGRPKGVVTRHSALSSQVSTVAETWQWTEKDNLLHVLPLNHLHGVVVALLPTIWAGASVEMWEKFDGPAIWKRWINEAKDEPISMFFGVPTVYSRLIAAHAALSPEEQKIASTASGSLRLQVSGSAPLPESLKRTWEAPGGVGGGMILLERYGMTETGIIAGTGWEHIHRVKGHVGWPLRNVELRLWDEEKGEVVTEPDRPGEVQVIGPGIFNEYWKLPEVTVKEFKDGYFKTGDVAVYSSEAESKGQIRILGRNSTDIIKSGGEKISAVEIERAILELEGTKDVAVVGVEDVEWGQVVGVCLVTTKSDTTVDSLRKALRPMIAAYKLPRKVKLYEGEIPRNNMGKVNKKKLVLEAYPAATVP